MSPAAAARWRPAIPGGKLCGVTNARSEANKRVFDENRQKLLGDDADPLNEGQRAEVLRRRDMALAHPELLEPWDGMIERVRARLNEVRRSNASAG